VVAPSNIDGLSPAELRQLLLKLLEENAELKRQNAGLREEIARLKGLKGRPSINPVGWRTAPRQSPAEEESVAAGPELGDRAKTALFSSDQKQVVEVKRMIKRSAPGAPAIRQKMGTVAGSIRSAG